MTIREKCLSKNFVPSPIPNGKGHFLSLFQKVFCKKITPAIKASAKKSHSQFVSGTDSFCLLSNNHFKLFVLFAIKITFLFYNRLEHSYCNMIGDFFV